MRWTIWQQRTTCTQCGAKLTVPESGLAMRCEFCSNEQAVPDIEARRKKLRKTAHKTADTAHKARIEEELARAEQLEHYARAAGAVTGAIRGLVMTALTLGTIALVLHFTGLLKRLYEPFFGDPGLPQLERVAQRVKDLGYVPHVGRPKSVGFFFRPKKVYLQLEAKRCYAVVVGSGQPIARVELRDPRRRRVTRHATLRFHDTLVHCPRLSGAFTLTVTLAEAGRFSYRVFEGKKPIDVHVAAPQTVAPRKVTQRRRKRRRARHSVSSKAQRGKGKAKIKPPARRAKPAPLPVPPGPVPARKRPDPLPPKLAPNDPNALPPPSSIPPDDDAP